MAAIARTFALGGLLIAGTLLSGLVASARTVHSETGRGGSAGL
jgi:hypothetical protein